MMKCFNFTAHSTSYFTKFLLIAITLNTDRIHISVHDVPTLIYILSTVEKIAVILKFATHTQLKHHTTTTAKKAFAHKPSSYPLSLYLIWV